MSGIGIVLNPHSRSNKRHPGRAERLGFIVGDRGSCYETNSLEDVARLAGEFKEKGIEVLGISGGDGTLHKTLTAFINVYGDAPLPKIAFLRGGTMNNTAGLIGVHGTPEKILSDLIVKYHENKDFNTTELNMINVNGYYGFLFGMGIVTKFLQEFEEKTKGDTRPIWAALLLIKHMIGSLFNSKAACELGARMDARVSVNGEELPFKNYSMLFAGTIESLCFNFRPLWLARTLEKEFHFMGLSATPRQVVSLFPKAAFMKPIRAPYVIDRVGDKMTIDFPEPQLYSIDGDFPEPAVKHIAISMGPKLTCILS